MDPCQKKQAILPYNSRCQCLVAALLQNTMPWTADQKRKRRDEQAGAAGKQYKPRKHPCIRELQLPALEGTPPPPVEQNQQSNLTVQEEMERARMEVEDCRVRVQNVMQASAASSLSTRRGYNRVRRCISGRTTPTSCSSAKGGCLQTQASQPRPRWALASQCCGGSAKREGSMHQCAS